MGMKHTAPATPHAADSAVAEFDQRALWEDYARVYRQLRALMPYRDLLFEIIACADIDSDVRLLDVCCGDGGLLWALHAGAYDCPVVGVDNSPAMLARARTEPYGGTTQFVRADVNEPITDWGLTGRFDRIVCNNGLYAVDDPTRVLAQLASVANPGAVLIVSTPRPNPCPEAVLAEHLWQIKALGADPAPEERRLRALLGQVAHCNMLIAAQEATRVFHFPEEKESRDWFAHTGWRVTEVRPTYAGMNWMARAQREAST
jgi:2-polyprenyl-3-methyl-5-hydroxy-6-metoxy-1,4-benzoquinol methylase